MKKLSLSKIHIKEINFADIQELRNIIESNNEFFIQIITNESYITIQELLNLNTKLVFSSQNIILEKKIIYFIVDDNEKNLKFSSDKIIFYSKNIFTDYCKFIINFSDIEKKEYFINKYTKKEVQKIIPFLKNKNLSELDDLLKNKKKYLNINLNKEESFVLLAVYKNKKLHEIVKFLSNYDEVFKNSFYCFMILNELVTKQIIRKVRDSFFVNVSRESVGYALKQIEMDINLLD